MLLKSAKQHAVDHEVTVQHEISLGTPSQPVGHPWASVNSSPFGAHMLIQHDVHHSHIPNMLCHVCIAPQMCCAVWRSLLQN
jgi:hypothetical protein